MDARRFDALARSLVAFGTRRGVLRLVAALPLLGGLGALLAADAAAEAKGRGHRREKVRKQGKGKGKGKPKKKCRPHSRARTCNGRCGSVKNNCRKSVDCGSCDCVAECPLCHSCSDVPGVPGACIPDFLGQLCGAVGRVCQHDGTCVCLTVPNTCPHCTACGDDGSCHSCTGCCAGGTCVSDCGACHVCQAGQCTSCDDLSQGCCADACVDLESDPEHCGDCETACGAGHVCHAGICEVCVCPGDAACFDTVQEAHDAITTVAGDIVRICAGAFPGAPNVIKALRLIGAGQGLGGTVLEGGDVVVVIAAGTESQPVELTGLRIQGGKQGINVIAGHVIMNDCTVRDNIGGDFGGGIVNQGSNLTLNGCTVEHNILADSVLAFGGGIANRNGILTMTDCFVRNNTANRGGGINSFNQGAEVTLLRTVVSGNVARDGIGSGIENHVDFSTVTLGAGSHVCANDPVTDQCFGFDDPTNACQATCPE